MAILALVAGLAVLDIVMDAPTDWFTPHILLELTLVALSLGSAAVLNLRGLGHKQIAAAMGRSERTVRQHAVSVYQKSGLGGRAELAAFFLEGLSLPVQDS